MPITMMMITHGSGLGGSGGGGVSGIVTGVLLVITGVLAAYGLYVIVKDN